MTTLINVLIVDDDWNDRYVARRQLAKNPRIGTIVEADGGPAAHEMFDSGQLETDLGPPPHRLLVLLDINMPAMSGFELLERLDADGLGLLAHEAVIAMLTSSTYPGDRERAAASAFIDDYIEKPLTPDKIEHLLGRFWSTDVSATEVGTGPS